MVLSRSKKLTSQETKSKSKSNSFTHDGFYDDHSSSSDDDYLYSRSDFASDSSDSDYDRSMHHSERIVFVDGRPIKPKNNPSLAKKVQRNNDDVKLSVEYRPPTRIRFAEDSLGSPVVIKNDSTGDHKVRSKTIVRIHCKNDKAVHHLNADKEIEASDNRASITDTYERHVATDQRQAVAKIKIQSSEGSNAHKPNAQVVTNGHMAEEECSKLRRADSGFLQESSSSVSQDTADSFDKEDGSRMEPGDRFEKVAGKTARAVIDRKDRGRFEGNKEIKIDVMRNQQDSGFEDPERVSPGGVSSKENSLQRSPVLPSGSSSNDYSKVLRQTSLRVFGLVGRRVKGYNDPGNRAKVNAFVRSGCSVNTEGNGNERGNVESTLLRRLNERLTTHMTLSNEAKAEESVDSMVQNNENADGEEEWPEPPTFDEDLIAEDRTETDVNSKIAKEGEKSHESNLNHASSIVTMPHNIADMKEKERNSFHFENLDFRQNNQFGSDRNQFKEFISGSERDFKEYGEGEIFDPEMSAVSYHGDIFMPNQKIYDQNVIFDHNEVRLRQSELDFCHEEHFGGKNDRRLGDDCTVCERLKSDKKVSRRSADMEHFRKTTLGDCDSVMKKMRHAQQIARKISGDESPRRASMRKSRPDGSATSAEGSVSRPNSTAVQEKRRFGEERFEMTRNVGANSVDYVEGDLQANAVAKKKNQVTYNEHEKKMKDATANAATVQSDFHVSTRQQFESQFDAKDFFIQQFNREKNRQKVKRNLSEDFLIVNAMPYSQHREYGNPHYHADPSQSIVPQYNFMHGLNRGPQFDAPGVNSRPSPQVMYNHDPFFRSEPRSYSPRGTFAADYDESQSTAFNTCTSCDGTFQLPDQWYREAMNSPNNGFTQSTPSRQSAMTHHSNNAKSAPLSPRRHDQKGPFIPNSQFTAYSQHNFDGKTSTDPFRAEREKSWFKKAARRLRRSLSFEDNNSRSAEKQEIFAEHQPIRPCNSSGNLKDECGSYHMSGTRGRLYSDEGPRQAVKRSVRLPTKGKDCKSDPNFHPKYGFMAKEEGHVQKSNGEMRHKAPLHSYPNGNSPNVSSASNFVVQHNMYFGNNPSSQNSQILGNSGGGGLLDGKEVVEPLQVRRSSQKTAKTKLLHSKR